MKRTTKCRNPAVSQIPTSTIEEDLNPRRLGENGRFRVVGKLGHGGFEIVWLCHDSLVHKWRAVKILAVKVSTPTEEVERHEITHYCIIALSGMVVWKYLPDLFPPTDPTLHKHHIFMPLESFWIHGPNGDHLCEVFPLLGPALSDIYSIYLLCTALLKSTHQLFKVMKALFHQWLKASPQAPLPTFLMVERTSEQATQVPPASALWLHHKVLSCPSHILSMGETKPRPAKMQD
ncbi:hypothetical protein QBC36DRAFT_193905 [Triangularia setosa]|uniref:non-specific serine/threonine protein kinase n=1 Tax=Triangularia setosa TaxID=2587417 RepID=A0AAN7A599_9PEZI|nr:hypothetical protein QBC36DRAFT_193905 [Podospora setosa]